MEEKNCFYKFVSESSCNSSEFKKAHNYYSTADLKERKLYYRKIMRLVERCLLVWQRQGKQDAQSIRFLFGKFGIPENYFISLLKNYVSGDNKEQNEEVFWEAKDACWQKYAIYKIAKEKSMDLDAIQTAIANYAWHTLFLDKPGMLKYQNTYLAFHDFINQKKDKENRDNVYFYYLHYAQESEKELFKDYTQKIISKILNAQEEESKHILKRLKWDDYDLYYISQLVNLGVETKAKILARLKPYYDFAASIQFDSKITGAKAQKMQMRHKDFQALIVAYAKYVLYIDDIEEQIRDFNKKRNYFAPLYATLDKLLVDKDKEQIKNLFIKLQLNETFTISCYCHAYHAFSHDFDKQETEAFLLECYREILNERKKTSRIVQESPKVAENKTKKVSPFDLTRISKEILGFIQNGINSREFTIFDYYLMYKDTNLHQISYSGLDLDIEQRTTLRRFFKPLAKINLITKDMIMRTNYEFNSLKDDKGFPISGTGYTLRDEEKQEVIAFFTTNNIPLGESLVSIAMRLYANQALEAPSLQRS